MAAKQTCHDYFLLGFLTDVQQALEETIPGTVKVKTFSDLASIAADFLTMGKHYRSDEEYARALQGEEGRMGDWMQGSGKSKRLRLITFGVDHPASSSAVRASSSLEKDSTTKNEYAYYHLGLLPLNFSHHHRDTDTLRTLLHDRVRTIFDTEAIYDEALDRLANYPTMEVVESFGRKNGFLIKTPKGIRPPFADRYWTEKVEVREVQLDAAARAAVEAGKERKGKGKEMA